MTEQAISALRRRMIEDMAIRKFAAKTQHDYVQRVKDFAGFLGRAPDTARSEDVRRVRRGDAGGVGRPAEGVPAMSDLIVIGYPDEHRAHDVWAELVKLGYDYLVDLEDAAIIWRDENGKVHVTTPRTTRWPRVRSAACSGGR